MLVGKGPAFKGSFTLAHGFSILALRGISGWIIPYGGAALGIPGLYPPDASSTTCPQPPNEL